MKFLTKTLDNATVIIYGFRDDDKNFYMISTLEMKEESAEIHGFLSKGSLTPSELIELARYFQRSIGKRYIEFDVLNEHSKVYKEFFHVIQCFGVKTFNNHDAQHLLIDMEKGIKHFTGRKRNGSEN